MQVTSRRSILTRDERDRRWSLLERMIRQQNYDALVFAANDHRGHKGALRYVADYNLAHRYGYAVMAPGREPTVVVPLSMAGCERSDWVDDFRPSRNTAAAIAEIIGQLPAAKRVGIVGLNQIMRVEELRRLESTLPGIEFVDASDCFGRTRAVKSAEEIAGLEEVAEIADRCFERLLEIACPGMTKRTLGAELYKTNTELGGEDPIFLTMTGAVENGQAVYAWNPPRDEVLRSGDLLSFSFEQIGPSGYWVELCRMVTFGPATDEQCRIHRAAVETQTAAQETLRAGATPTAVQHAIVQAADAHAATTGYWSGHGIGLDVIEDPWVGLETVEDIDDAHRSEDDLVTGMTFAIHPFLLPRDDGPGAYISQTYVIDEAESRPLSQHGLDLYEL